MIYDLHDGKPVEQGLADDDPASSDLTVEGIDFVDLDDVLEARLKGSVTVTDLTEVAADLEALLDDGSEAVVDPAGGGPAEPAGGEGRRAACGTSSRGWLL